jgi:hypothetical protein
VRLRLNWDGPHLYYFKIDRFISLEGNSTIGDLLAITKDRKILPGNRSFIEGTLHRISITRGLDDDITATTLRIGRPIVGLSEIFTDLIAEKKSILFMGPPGLGKTSMIRDLARNVSGMDRKTIIIDSSCEITGYKSTHPVIGNAYVMYVPLNCKKEEIMIQAIQNRTPQVLIVDEIGNLQEYGAVQSASTRGVTLYATAHGSLKDVGKSTIVMKLLGGVTSVTLGDEMMGQNDGEKTKLESKGPPLFDILVEFDKDDKYKWYIYDDIPNLAKNLFKKKTIKREVRIYDEKNQSWSQWIEKVDVKDMK